MDLYYKAPKELKDNLRKLALEEAEASQSHRRFFSSNWIRALAVAMPLTIVVILFRPHSSPTTTDLISQEIVSSHVRSMMVNHLTDVPSEDRHTVKPWFNGKLNFSPKVIDLKDEGFELTGGRLDYLNGRPVAALIYKRREHIINLLTWPTVEVVEDETHLIARQGFHLFHWVSQGMQYWAISDLNANELKTFTDLIRQH
jgi:anti-sigma factor RsiW